MFKIEDVRKTTELTQGKNIRKTGGENFADYLNTGGVSKQDQIQATSAMTSADAIFAAQMVQDEEERQIRQKLVKKGNALLEKLEEIRDGLLVGEISKEKLIDISRFVKERDMQSSDPRLQEILQEIELRVEVELAKLM